MIDNLENFVGAHRDDFDDKAPDDKIWRSLENRLKTEEQGGRRHRSVIRLPLSGKKWVSAAAVLLLCVSLAGFVRTYQVKSQMTNASLPKDLVNAKAYYENQLAVKIDRIKSMDSRYNIKDTSLWQIFGQPDAEYKRLQNAVRENPGDPHVRAAFVEYYRSRLAVLDRIEQKMQEDTFSERGQQQ